MAVALNLSFDDVLQTVEGKAAVKQFPEQSNHIFVDLRLIDQIGGRLR